MITFADKSKEKDLIEIWHRSFGDSAEYIQMFLEWNAARAKIVVYEIKEKPVSVAYLLPLVYRKAGAQDIPCWYLYAAATLPEYRGHGYFSDILAFIKAHVPEPVILVPAEHSLIGYYEKQGLYVWQQEEVTRVAEDTHQGSETAMMLHDIDVETYTAIRDAYFGQTGYMKWDEHFLKYIFQENIICGGRQQCICIDGISYAAIYRMEGTCLKILELIRQDAAYTMVQADEIISCAAALIKVTGATSALVCIRPTVMAIGKLPLQSLEGYFNLTMG